MTREPMKVSPSAPSMLTPDKQLSRLMRAEHLMNNPTAPWYPENVGPAADDPIRLAQDAEINTVLGYANQTWPGMGFLGFPFLAELSQISEYRQISTRLAQEMTRKWIHFRSTSEEDKSEELKKIQAEFDRLEVKQRMREMAEYDGLFGRGQLYMDFGPITNEELGTPLLIDKHKIKKGSLIRLQPIEPLYSYAYDYNAEEPLDRHFYQPRTWYIMKRVVHNSRLLTFISRPLPTMLKPVYAFSGLSMSQLAMATIENFLRMRQSVSNIVLNYSLRGIQTNLEGLLQGGVEQIDSILQRIQIYTQQSSNEGLMVLDKESEAFFQHTTPLTNIDRLLDQARDNMCAVANIPRMVLFGLSPEGMNASAAGELEVFEQYVAGMQETLFRHPLEKLLKIVQLSLFGKIDDGITFDFVPLRELDEKALAEVRESNARATNIYGTLGAVASDEIRKKLADDPYSGWDNLDTNRVVVPVEPPANEMNPTGQQENRTGEPPQEKEVEKK